MIAPILPGAEGLIKELVDKVDHVLVERLNYHYANRIYLENKMEWAKEYSSFLLTSSVEQVIEVERKVSTV